MKAFKLSAALSFILFIFLSFLAHSSAYFSFDVWITRAIQTTLMPGLNSIMELISTLGNVVYGSVIVFAFSAILYYFKLKKEIFWLLFSTGGLSAASLLLKKIIARPRPDPGLIVQFNHYSKADSFPSGHVLFYMGLYGFLLFLIITKLKKNTLRKILITVNLSLIALIGISRIYLGAHWFSDTLGSYLLGIFWLYTVIYLYKKLI